MRLFVLIFFFSVFYFCRCAVNDDLKPLKLPEDLSKGDEDKTTTLQRLLKALGIDFNVSNQEKIEKSKIEKSPLYKLRNYYKSWFGTKDKDVLGTCFTELDNFGVPRVTTLGDFACQTKCTEENKNHTTYLNKKLQFILSMAPKSNIAAVFEPSLDEKGYECVPSGDGYVCKCKKDAQIKVNQRLQEIFDQYLNKANTDVRGANNDVKYGNGGGYYQNYPPQNKKNSHFFIKLVGLLLVAMFCFPLVPVYLIWWIIS